MYPGIPTVTCTKIEKNEINEEETLRSYESRVDFTKGLLLYFSSHFFHISNALVLAIFNLLCIYEMLRMYVLIID